MACAASAGCVAALAAAQEGPPRPGVTEPPVVITEPPVVTAAPPPPPPKEDLDDTRAIPAQPVPPPTSKIKICKVAGPGVKVGTKFTFKVGSFTRVVKAGPAPGGNCGLMSPSYPAGVAVVVKEVALLATRVEGVSIAPAQALSTNLTARTATFKPVAGVNVVTFTNVRGQTGYLEICKVFKGTAPKKPYTFRTGTTEVRVPAGGCSPPILVPAGVNLVKELGHPSSKLQGCSALPASALLSPPCTNGSRTAKVLVKPGNVSQETIVTFTNGPRKPVKTGRLRVCKQAGADTAPGHPFPMEITLPDGSTTLVYVPAGTCVVVGSYPVGTTIGVADGQSFYHLFDATAHSSSGGSAVFHDEVEHGNPAYFDVTIGSGPVTAVSFTNTCRYPDSPICKVGS